MARKTWGATSVLMLGILLAGCAEENAGEESVEVNEANPLEQTVAEQEEEIKKLEEQLAAFQETIDSQELDLKYASEEATVYREQLEGLLTNLDDSELTEFAKSQWTYELTVNGESAPADGQVAVDNDNAEITLVQKQAPYTVLPYEVFNKGKISGDYEDHIQNFSREPEETVMADGTVNSGVTYVFPERPEGEEISLTITGELKERLGLNVDQITVVTE